MRIDNPTIQGDITLPATSSGHFSGSFEGDGGQLTNVAPLAGDNITVTGTTVALSNTVTGLTSISATTGSFVLQLFESSSTIIHSGSNVFGDENTDTQQFTGSILISGSGAGAGSSMIATGSINISGSLGVGTAASGVVGAILATNDVVAFSTSDERLKENVELIGKSPSNINIYKFNYKDNSTTYQGVMAHEVPWASVKHSNGYMMVDYNKVDVEFKKWQR